MKTPRLYALGTALALLLSPIVPLVNGQQAGGGGGSAGTGSAGTGTAGTGTAAGTSSPTGTQQGTAQIANPNQGVTQPAPSQTQPAAGQLPPNSAFPGAGINPPMPGAPTSPNPGMPNPGIPGQPSLQAPAGNNGVVNPGTPGQLSNPGASIVPIVPFAVPGTASTPIGQMQATPGVAPNVQGTPAIPPAQVQIQGTTARPATAPNANAAAPAGGTPANITVSPALSGAAGVTVNGRVVRTLAPDQFVVQVGNQQMTFVANPQTRFVLGGFGSSMANLKVGSNVNIDYVQQGNRFIANTVLDSNTGGSFTPAPAPVNPVVPPGGVFFEGSELSD